MATQLEIFRLVHNTHSAATQLLHDAVVRNGLADHWAEILGPELGQVNEEGGVSGCDLLRLLAYHAGVERPVERYTNYPYRSYGCEKTASVHGASSLPGCFPLFDRLIGFAWEPAPVASSPQGCCTSERVETALRRGDSRELCSRRVVRVKRQVGSCPVFRTVQRKLSMLSAGSKNNSESDALRRRARAPDKPAAISAV